MMIYLRFATLFASLSVSLPGFTPAAAAERTVTATVEWDPNPESDIAGYIVRFARVGGGQVKEVNVGNNTAVVIEDLKIAREYVFFVIAYNEAGEESLPSEGLHIYTVILLPPPAIHIVTTTRGNAVLLGDGEPRQLYAVAFSNDLNAFDWNVLGAVAANTEGEFQIEDHTSNTSPFRFYLVFALPDLGIDPDPSDFEPDP
jgi:hypothetical protein